MRLQESNNKTENYLYKYFAIVHTDELTNQTENDNNRSCLRPLDLEWSNLSDSSKITIYIKQTECVTIEYGYGMVYKLITNPFNEGMCNYESESERWKMIITRPSYFTVRSYSIT